MASTYATTNGSMTNSSVNDRYKLLYEKEKEENDRLRRKIDDLNVKLSKTEVIIQPYLKNLFPAEW